MKLSNDSHVHLTLDEDLKQTAHGFRLYQKGSNIDKITFLGLNPTFGQYYPFTYNQNSKCLYLKSCFGAQGYAGFGLDYTAEISEDGFYKQIVKAYNAGFDCWKVIEGKPLFQKDLGFPVDHTIYDKAYDFAEEKNFPLLCT